MSDADPMNGSGRGRKAAQSARSSLQSASLPKRFYTSVSVEEKTGGDGCRVLLDGRPVRTPKKNFLTLPTPALGGAVAAEWAAQTTHIDPATMPLTRLANTALDGVSGREADVRADIVRYAGNDLLCYRAEHPQGLVHRQSEQWDPILGWAGEALAAAFVVQRGLMPVTQPAATLDAFSRVLPLAPFELTALHVMTTLMGSALLAWAVSMHRLDVPAAWVGAHVDEDWQIEKWGVDDEATARRAHRFTEMAAAESVLRLSSAR